MKQDLKFLREYFKIPKYVKVCWGLVEEERVGIEVSVRPCLIVGTSHEGGKKIYLDIAQRRFYTEVSLQYFDRKVHPAKRQCRKDCDVWITKNGRLNASRSKNWVQDIYYPTIYNKNFKDELLL